MTPHLAAGQLGEYFKAADRLAAYLKCVSEVAAGNREFVKAKAAIHNSLTELDMPAVKYFLEVFAPDHERLLVELA